MAVKIFFCYAHEDEALLNKLKARLIPLQRDGLVDVLWHDRDISAGTEWEREIDTHLNSAQIILLLISPDFMASDYCYGKEMKRAMERHESGEARVIPIILRPVNWKMAPFSKLQVLPKDAKPVISWHNRDAAFLNVAESIRKVIEQLSPSPPFNLPITLVKATKPEKANFVIPIKPEQPVLGVQSNRRAEMKNTSNGQSKSQLWAIIVAVGIILGIIASAITIYEFPSFFRSNQSPGTTQSSPTFTSATSTVISTVAASPSSTVTVPAIATLDASLSNPYPPHQGTLALNTSFTTTDSSWDNSSNCQITNKAYSVTTSYGFTECLENVDSYSNFVYQVQMKFLTKDTCGGILFREQSNPYVAQYYEFYICTDGTYQFGSYYASLSSLANGSSLFNTDVGDANFIAIAARGTQFELYINGQMVNKGSDSSYSIGRIGVFVSFLTDLKASDKVAFNDVRVWQV
jgi:TIR domain-containing protein/3-keto-disaccharide hydrolase